MKNIFISLFIIISLTYCAKPPTIEKIKQIIQDTPSVVKKIKIRIYHLKDYHQPQQKSKTQN